MAQHKFASIIAW